MRLIDADRLSDHVLAESHTGSELEMWAWLEEALKTEPAVEAIPIDDIREMIINPDNAGDKSRVLSWLLRRWEEK